jgi:hypothetical protein
MENSTSPEIQDATADLDNIIRINNSDAETEDFDYDFDYDPNEMYYALARENQ